MKRKETERLQKTFDNYVVIATLKDKCTLQMIGNMSILLQAFLEQDFHEKLSEKEFDDIIRFFETFLELLKFKRLQNFGKRG